MPQPTSASGTDVAAMDLNFEYAAHQRCLMAANDAAASDADRSDSLATASRIAGRIGDYQQRLGAAAACAWSHIQLRHQAEQSATHKSAWSGKKVK